MREKCTRKGKSKVTTQNCLTDCLFKIRISFQSEKEEQREESHHVYNETVQVNNPNLTLTNIYLSVYFSCPCISSILTFCCQKRGKQDKYFKSRFDTIRTFNKIPSQEGIDIQVNPEGSFKTCLVHFQFS